MRFNKVNWLLQKIFTTICISYQFSATDFLLHQLGLKFLIIINIFFNKKILYFSFTWLIIIILLKIRCMILYKNSRFIVSLLNLILTHIPYARFIYERFINCKLSIVQIHISNKSYRGEHTLYNTLIKINKILLNFNISNKLEIFKLDILYIYA